jgi:hypothetical protein
MQDTLIAIHPWIGYAVFLLALIATLIAFARAKSGREFEPGTFVLTMVAIDIQVLLGIVLYGVGQYWEADQALLAYVHPLLALAALGVGHAGIGRARREPMAADAYRTVGRALIVVLVLVTAAIGVSTAAG